MGAFSMEGIILLTSLINFIFVLVGYFMCYVLGNNEPIKDKPMVRHLFKDKHEDLEEAYVPEED